jgi:tetratricopeptide (TPR) repeat protein
MTAQLDTGFQQLQAGQLSAAEATCRALLADSPDTADAHYLLGLIMQATGRIDDALTQLTQAIRLQPDHAPSYRSLGYLSLAQDDPAAAGRYFQRLIALDPADPQSYIDRGNAAFVEQDVERASACYRQALLLAPDNVQGLSNLGGILLAQGHPEAAIDYLRRAAKLRPELVEVQLKLGVALSAVGDFAAAIACCRAALALRPSHPEAYYNLGVALKAQGSLAEAIAAYQECIALKPDWPEAHLNLGAALQACGQIPAAIERYRAAEQLRPGWHIPQHNLAEAYLKAGALDQAIAHFRESLRRAPQYQPSQLDLSMALLERGDFVEGWQRFEWRWDCDGYTPCRDDIDAPLWDGAPLDGRTILLWAEQGFGDSIQCIRYAPLIQAQGGRVWLDCPPELARLLATCPGVERILGEDTPAEGIDVQLPLMSLPRIFKTRLDTIPAQVPYLFASDRDAPRIARRDITIGVAWASGPWYRQSAARNCTPADFRPLSETAGVQVYSLQHGESAAALRHDPALPIVDLSEHLQDWAATAALVQQMDLIITVDTALAHLAGALGKPVWVLLPQRADWRWLRERADSPWYPTMRLFRQSIPGEWSDVFVRVQAALQAEIAGRR